MIRKRVVAAGVVLILACVTTAVIAYRMGRKESVMAARAAADAPCVDFRNASSRIGQTGCVSGQVLRVFTSRGGNTFLDFCADYQNCPFTSVVFSSDRRNFGDLNALAGRRIEVRGPVTTYKGRAEIVVREPQQIREHID
jgi:hypothetical protein